MKGGHPSGASTHEASVEAGVNFAFPSRMIVVFLETDHRSVPAASLWVVCRFQINGKGATSDLSCQMQDT